MSVAVASRVITRQRCGPCGRSLVVPIVQLPRDVRGQPLSAICSRCAIRAARAKMTSQLPAPAEGRFQAGACVSLSPALVRLVTQQAVLSAAARARRKPGEPEPPRPLDLAGVVARHFAGDFGRVGMLPEPPALDLDPEQLALADRLTRNSAGIAMGSGDVWSDFRLDGSDLRAWSNLDIKISILGLAGDFSIPDAVEVS